MTKHEKPGLVRDGRTGVLLGAVLLSLLAACTSPATKAKAPAENRTGAAVALAPPADSQVAGKIIRVNAESGYVVVECAVLPNSGEVARVLRGEFEVGRVRFSGPFYHPYATADVIEGRPQAGDRVRK